VNAPFTAVVATLTTRALDEPSRHEYVPVRARSSVAVRQDTLWWGFEVPRAALEDLTFGAERTKRCR